MRRPWKQNRRFNTPRKIEAQICKQLLHDVWSLDWEPGRHSIPPGPYIEHWRNLLQSAQDGELCLGRNQIAIPLVQKLQTGLDKTLSTLRDEIQNQYPNPIVQKSIAPDQATTALEFAIRLWLHIYPALQGTPLPNLTLRELIVQNIPSRTAATKAIEGRLTSDFCAKHLKRRGGIRIYWTDDINEHLAIDPADRTICVFRHANMLYQLAQPRSNDPFPPGFIKETLDTLHLLFRPLNTHKSRHTIRRMEKRPQEADLELAEPRTASLDLASYPYWHARLKEIQAAYDHKRPATMQQWWFDRRDRVQWATFWVAFVVFVLTVVFGVVQSVTGVLQVWVAYHPPK